MARAHRTVAVDLETPPRPEPRTVNLPWYLLALFGPIVVLLGAWVVLAAVASIGWLISADMQFATTARFAGEVLLLAHGMPVDLAGQMVSVAPLGVTLGILYAARPVAQIAARSAAAQMGTSDDTGKIWADPEAVVFRVGGAFTGVHAVSVIALSAMVGVTSFRVLLGAIVLGGIAGFWGACRGIDYDPTEVWPSWLRAVPRAVAASGLFVIAAGAAALVVALWNGRARVAEVFTSLDGGISALLMLSVLHVAYLPNFVLACCSWVLGAGVSVGDGSLITVAMTDVGIMPAMPIFGIVPESGPAPAVAMWWLSVGVVAGAFAALVVSLARPRARFDHTALTGALAGILAGLTLAVACSLGSGGLGKGRLAHIGARVPELMIFAPTILGLSGLAAGLVLGLIRRPTPQGADPEDVHSLG